MSHGNAVVTARGPGAVAVVTDRRLPHCCVGPREASQRRSAGFHLMLRGCLPGHEGWHSSPATEEQ